MIELKNVERSYKTGHAETWVLRRIGLTIKEGEFVTVMGPSGAGKSSLLNVLALLDDSWLGEYWFGSTPVHSLNRKQRADLARTRIGMVFQSYHLLDDLTVAENIDLPLSYKNMPAKDREMLAAVVDMINKTRGRKIKKYMITKIRTKGNSETSMLSPPPRNDGACANAGEMNMKGLCSGGYPGGACRPSGARNVRGI